MPISELLKLYHPTHYMTPILALFHDVLLMFLGNVARNFFINASISLSEI